MPGYEFDRFVRLSESEKSELICSICRGIFKDPLVTNCCLQSFCKDCINRWLDGNNSCPFDRQPLTHSCLRASPRALNNLLGKLKITCDYRDQGCEEVINLDQLGQHLINCPFNVTICKTCFCPLNEGHICVTELLALNRKGLQEVENLKIENEKLKTNIDEINTNFLHKIISLENEKQKLKKKVKELHKRTKVQFDLSEFLNRVRLGQIDRELKVFKSTMDRDQVDYVKTITFDVLDNYETTEEIAHQMEARMTSKYPLKTWNCFLYTFGNARYGFDDFHIIFGIHEIIFVIFSTDL